MVDVERDPVSKWIWISHRRTDRQGCFIDHVEGQATLRKVIAEVISFNPNGVGTLAEIGQLITYPAPPTIRTGRREKSTEGNGRLLTKLQGEGWGRTCLRQVDAFVVAQIDQKRNRWPNRRWHRLTSHRVSQR